MTKKKIININMQVFSNNDSSIEDYEFDSIIYSITEAVSDNNCVCAMQSELVDEDYEESIDELLIEYSDYLCSRLGLNRIFSGEIIPVFKDVVKLNKGC